MVDALPRHVTLLAGSGLLPYLGAALVIVSGPPDARAAAGDLLSVYSFGIIVFLVGAWWGLTLIKRAPLALYCSNGIFLAAFVAHAWLPVGTWLGAAAALMLLIWWVEGRLHLFRPQPSYYRRLRGLLSAVAACSLLLSAIILSVGGGGATHA